jgi:hypothetical protein
MRRSGPIAAALAAAIALGAPATPALAGAFTLNLSQQTDAVVGRPLIIHATGTIPPQDIGFPYWFSLDAVPTAVTTTCPPDRWEGAQFGNATVGGGIVVLTQSENPDPAGNFTIPVATTPIGAGSLLLCAYTDDGAAATLATASLTLDIKPAPSTAASRPPKPPAFAAEGIRSCRALFARPATCIRHILRKANARCRRLPTRRVRTRCLRAVGRAARTRTTPFAITVTAEKPTTPDRQRDGVRETPR